MHCLVDALMDTFGLSNNVPSKGVKLCAGKASVPAGISSRSSTSTTRQDLKTWSGQSDIRSRKFETYCYEPPNGVIKTFYEGFLHGVIYRGMMSPSCSKKKIRTRTYHRPWLVRSLRVLHTRLLLEVIHPQGRRATIVRYRFY